MWKNTVSCILVCIVILLTSCSQVSQSSVPASDPAQDNEPQSAGEQPAAENSAMTNKPKDFINDKPLYIEYAEHYKDEYQSIKEKYYYKLTSGGRQLIISYDGRLAHIKIYNISRDRDRNFWYEDSVFSIWHPGMGGFILYYTTYLSEWSQEALVLTDYDGNSYVCVLSHNEEDGTIHAERANILRHKRDEESVRAAIGGAAAVPITFYSFYDWPFEEYDSVTEAVSADNFIDEVAGLIYLHTGTRINDLWYEGSKLYVDLDAFEEFRFDMGSSGSTVLMHELTYTLASFPGVETFEVLVDGKQGVEANHYSFNGIFEVRDSKPYWERNEVTMY